MNSYACCTYNGAVVGEEFSGTNSNIEAWNWIQEMEDKGATEGSVIELP